MRTDWLVSIDVKFCSYNQSSFSLVKVGGNGLCQLKAPKGTFIQFSGAVNQAVNNDLFTRHLLTNITEENVELNDIFQEIGNKVYHESNQRQKPFFASGISQNDSVYLNGKNFL